MNQDLIYQIAVGNLPGIGFQRIKNIHQKLESFEAFFHLKKRDAQEIFSVPTNQVCNWNFQEVMDDAERQLEFIAKHNLKAFSYLNKAYPFRLKECQDAPSVLYGKGALNLNEQRMVAVVGTRNISDYGKQICSDLIAGLKDQGCTVISGMAYGIDIKAHTLCLEHEIPTIGVLAHGLDRLYPSAHSSIATKMMDQGGLITEFPIGTNPDRENFPKRNRIVAGMVDAVIVIESGEKGGSLITCDLANGYNRDVFAFPGSVNAKYSKGCNQLIRDNKALLSLGAEDFLKTMGWINSTNLKKTIQKELFIELNDDEKAIVSQLKKVSLTIDQLSIKLNKSISKLTVELLGLELKGVIQATPGNNYKML
jgi:DNA processing protein